MLEQSGNQFIFASNLLALSYRLLCYGFGFYFFMALHISEEMIIKCFFFQEEESAFLCPQVVLDWVNLVSNKFEVKITINENHFVIYWKTDWLNDILPLMEELILQKNKNEKIQFLFFWKFQFLFMPKNKLFLLIQFCDIYPIIHWISSERDT